MRLAQTGKIDWENDTINVALVDEFSPTYSAWAASTSYSEGDIVIPTSRNGRRYRAMNAGTSASSEPTWPTTDGGQVDDNDITWEEYGGEHADETYWDDISGNEVSGTNYTEGGKTLSGAVAANLAADPAITELDAEDVTWTNLTATFRHGVIYKAGSAGSDDYILGYVLMNDSMQDVSVDGVDFSLKWAVEGLFRIGRKGNVG